MSLSVRQLVFHPMLMFSDSVLPLMVWTEFMWTNGFHCCRPQSLFFFLIKFDDWAMFSWKWDESSDSSLETKMWKFLHWSHTRLSVCSRFLQKCKIIPLKPKSHYTFLMYNLVQMQVGYGSMKGVYTVWLRDSWAECVSETVQRSRMKVH